jgi:hypothetical protein
MEVTSFSKSGKFFINMSIGKSWQWMFRETHLEVMQLLDTVNSCKLTENMASDLLL